MSATTSFTVFHKNPEAKTVLGRGFVVGKVEQKTSYQYQGVLPKSEGSPIACLVTEEKIVIKYEVLWENQRHVSPSLHLSTELEWELLTEEYLAITSGVDTDDDDEDEGEETEDVMEMKEDDFISEVVDYQTADEIPYETL